MSEDPSEIELMAYVDGQLDPGRRFAVETRLSRRPDLAAQVMGDLSARTGLRLLAQDRAPLPEAMAAQASAISPPEPDTSTTTPTCCNGQADGGGSRGTSGC
jgi:anti-sigma factor RsiW